MTDVDRVERIVDRVETVHKHVYTVNKQVLVKRRDWCRPTNNSSLKSYAPKHTTLPQTQYQ